MVDSEATERILDLVGECVADGTMQYEYGDNDNIYVRLVESGALFEIVPGGLIRKPHPARPLDSGPEGQR